MDRRKEIGLIAKVDEINAERVSEGKPLIPVAVRQIDPFPVREFDALISGVRGGLFRVHRASAREGFVFDTVKSATDSLLFWFGIGMSVATPLAAIVLALTVSWWFLFLLFIFFLGMSLVAKAYDRAVFRAAFSSERAFCFLYWVRAINVFDIKSNRFFERPYNSDAA